MGCGQGQLVRLMGLTQWVEHMPTKGQRLLGLEYGWVRGYMTAARGLTVPCPVPPAAGWWPGSTPQSCPWRAQSHVLGFPQGSAQRVQGPGLGAGTSGYTGW